LLDTVFEPIRWGLFDRRCVVFWPIFDSRHRDIASPPAAAVVAAFPRSDDTDIVGAGADNVLK